MLTGRGPTSSRGQGSPSNAALCAVGKGRAARRPGRGERERERERESVSWTYHTPTADARFSKFYHFEPSTLFATRPATARLLCSRSSLQGSRHQHHSVVMPSVVVANKRRRRRSCTPSSLSAKLQARHDDGTKLDDGPVRAFALDHKVSRQTQARP